MSTSRPPYKAAFHGPHPGLNYRAERPFARWEAAHLLRSIRGWLAKNPPQLELATLAYEELKHRKHGLLEADLAFADRGLQTIDWLPQARKAAAQAFAPSWQGWVERKRKGGSVYVILRDGYAAKNGFFGAYVGSTTRNIEKRYLEHRDSSRAARGLIAYGIEPLFSLCLPEGEAPKARKALMLWETRMHQTLAGVVPRVSGDQVDVD